MQTKLVVYTATSCARLCARVLVVLSQSLLMIDNLSTIQISKAHNTSVLFVVVDVRVRLHSVRTRNTKLCPQTFVFFFRNYFWIRYDFYVENHNG